MRVVQAIGFGGPEVLVPGETPDPVAGPGQVVIEVAVAGMTFVETQIRRGTARWHQPPRLPYVPGGLVAGLVSAAGPGVDPAWLGQRVVAGTGGTGGFAERAVAPAEDLLPVPDGLSLPVAAALRTDGVTARGLVERAGIEPGDRVLIEAAAGAVGSLLVQLARAAGARVIGAAGGARKLRTVRELGADVVVDYAEPGWTGRVLEATGGAGPDVVFDGVGGRIGRAAFEVTARGGRFSVHGAASGELAGIDEAEAADRGVRVIGIDQLFGFRSHAARWADEVMALAAAGSLRPVIGQTFPLEQAAEAHAAIENRTAVGKTLLLI
ncbi:zinc-binding dehydrogenase [Actinoplanes teichomyceticus]|uniref:NADPH2:quinone reductase n=1 Tax=Actinoplanes teichomyceticus TaxID=1867 RepID=A0A561VCL8_ACTTI|nr:zinc-binding dehydrogenase [Actinoplanes teichomyceticus]TWG09356.1 NADPH2:quinone reductase [Actinoplanes teichomyceticus]GIF16620.1 NADPH:quinone reductase [Actinoplanes teichomyceticus]